jgi:hypothetical protein
MNGEQTLADAVRTLAGYDDLLFESTICIVSDVDIAENTCTCTPIGKDIAEFKSVQLSSKQSKGFLLIPADGSTVVVTQLNEFDAYISMVGEVDQIYLRGDAEGGIVKVNDLVAKLNNLESALNSHILLYNLHIHPTPAGPSSITSNLDTQTPLVPTIVVDLENDKIKHE